MSWDPYVPVAVPAPVALNPDDGVRWRSRAIFHPRRWRRIGSALDHHGRRRISVDDCFGAAGKPKHGYKAISFRGREEN
jgi:hypothetical protein